MNNFRRIRHCVYYLGTVGQKNLRFYVRRNTFDIVNVKCRLSHTPMTYDNKITVSPPCLRRQVFTFVVLLLYLIDSLQSLQTACPSSKIQTFDFGFDSTVKRDDVVGHSFEFVFISQALLHKHYCEESHESRSQLKLVLL